MSTAKYLSQFKTARKVGASLIGIGTPDPAATIERLKNGSAAETPHVAWDAARGAYGLGKPGEAAVRAMLDGRDPSITADVVQLLCELAPKLPSRTVLYLINVHRYLTDTSAQGATFVQAVWNLRDQYKRDTRTLVLLGPAITLPAELTNDVLILDEPLPDDAELGGIVEKVLTAFSRPCTPDIKTQAVDALRGLAAFPSEQATAIAAAAGPLDLPELWERKRQMIRQTPGLSVWTGGERFADVGGCTQAKSYFTRLIAGRDRFRVVVFMDEIDKQLAGVQGDNTGVTQNQHGQLLTYMQDRNVQGVRFLGPPGAGKSAISKAIGGEAGVLTIVLDLGAQKSSLVGDSEQRLAMSLKMIDAVGGGQALFVATCNRDAVLSPELRRRFATTFYFDLPDAEEKAAIWPIHLAKYKLEAKQARPDDAGWTGAEIRQACLLAYRLDIPLTETTQYIVPVSKSAAEELAALRRQADGRLLSASYPGTYTMPSQATAPQAGARRLASRV